MNRCPFSLSLDFEQSTSHGSRKWRKSRSVGAGGGPWVVSCSCYRTCANRSESSSCWFFRSYVSFSDPWD